MYVSSAQGLTARSHRQSIDCSTPAVVLKVLRDPFPHGSLGVVRTLGRLGVTALAFHDDRWAPAAFSRYDRGRLTARLRWNAPLAAVTALSELGKRLARRAVLIATEDLGAVLVDEYADQLREWFIFPDCPRGLPRVLSNKASLYRLCSELKVPTPRTDFPGSRAEFTQLLRHVEFPVLLKSIDPRLLQLRTQARSTTIAYSARRALQAYDRMEVAGEPNLMVQEYIPDLTAHWMMSGYFDARSECRFGLVGRKLRESRPGAGFTTLGQLACNPAVDRVSREFLKAVRYQGIVDIEWRFDARDRQYKLLDVNPRVGAQFRTFVGGNGLDAVRALYLDLTDQAVPPSAPDPGRKWLVENDDLVASILQWRRCGGSLLGWALSLNGVREAAWFASDDPMPFVAMCVRAAYESARWSVRRHPTLEGSSE